MFSKPIQYAAWLKKTVYLGKGLSEGTMEEAMLDFFYNGISPWIKDTGYIWLVNDESYVARKFLRFAYELYCTLKQGPTVDLYAPEPMHRNFTEDRDTFDMYLSSNSWFDLVDTWSFRDEIVGTRLEHMIREFCYIWIDVRYGKPGKWTQASLDMSDEDLTDDDNNVTVPDGNWSRRKYDLY